MNIKKGINKGFTLIELLAIISILAIILLIAIPAISNVIETSRKNSFKNTALSVFKAAEFSYDINKLNNQPFEDITIDLSDKNDPNIGLIDLKGEYPSGTVTILKDGTVEIEITNGYYCAVGTKDKLFLEKGNCGLKITFETNGSDDISSTHSSIVNVEGTNGELKYLWSKTQPTEENFTQSFENGSEVIGNNEDFGSGYFKLWILAYSSTGTPIIRSSNTFIFSTPDSYFKISETGIINNYNNEGGYDVIIPSTINGITVVSLSYMAMANKSLTSVILPNTLTSIGQTSFKGNNLTSIVIPEGVTTIQQYAFDQNVLTNVIIPDTVTSIGTMAFSRNALTRIEIPSSVKSFGSSVFANNIATEKELRDNSTISCSTTTPYGCTDITSCKTNGGEILEDGICYKKMNTDCFTIDESGALTAYNKICGINVVIPDNVTSISNNAFKDVPIISVNIPNSVTSIGNSAFYFTRLTNINIPNSVTSIGNSAFYDTGLTSLVISNSITQIPNNAFENNNIRNIIIPNSVTSIGTSAFYGNEFINLTIPDSVTYIGIGAFKYTGLTSIVIPDSVTYIGSEAFASNKLTEVTISKNITTIASSAFNSNKLTNVTIPNGVTSIGEFAFSGNKIETITIPDSVTVIGNYAFSNNLLTNITIPNNVTYIGRNAFDNNQLTNVEIPSLVKTIGPYAFYKNPLLTKITVKGKSSSAEFTSLGTEWNGTCDNIIFEM